MLRRCHGSTGAMVIRSRCQGRRRRKRPVFTREPDVSGLTRAVEPCGPIYSWATLSDCLRSFSSTAGFGPDGVSLQFNTRPLPSVYDGVQRLCGKGSEVPVGSNDQSREGVGEGGNGRVSVPEMGASTQVDEAAAAAESARRRAQERYIAEAQAPNGMAHSHAAGTERPSASAATLQRTDMWRYAARYFFSYRKARDWQGALAELELLDSQARIVLEEGASPRALKRERKEAVDWDSGLEQMHIVYNLIMDTLASAGRWREAFELVHQLRHRGLVVQNVKLNGVLKACSVAKQGEVASLLLAKMRDPSSGLPPPDIVSFNTTIVANAKAGRTAAALDLFYEMFQPPTTDSSSSETRRPGVESVRDTSRGPTEGGHAAYARAPIPTAATFNAALSACIPQAPPDGGEGPVLDAPDGFHAVEAAEMGCVILETMRRGDGGVPRPDTRNFKDVITACGRAGLWERAVSLLFAARDDGLQLTKAIVAATITACGQSGRWREAFSLLRDDMRELGLRPDKFCLNAAIRACAHAGEVSKAFNILAYRFRNDQGKTGKLSALRPDGITFGPILQALARKGDKELAMGVLREIKVHTGHAPNEIHYRSVASAFRNSGDDDGARGVLAECIALRKLKEELKHSNKLSSVDTSHATVENDDGKEATFSPPRRATAEGYIVHGNTGYEVQAQEKGPGLENDPSDSSGSNQHVSFTDRAGGLPHMMENYAPPRPTTRKSAVRAKARDERGVHVSQTRAGFESAHGDCDVSHPPQQLAMLASGFANDGNYARCLDILEDAKFGAHAALEKTRECRARSAQESTDQDWWTAIARKSAAEEQAKEALGGLKGCYEAAIEALGYSGQWIEALQLLMEASARLGTCSAELSSSVKLNPSCFAPALRASGRALPNVSPSFAQQGQIEGDAMGDALGEEPQKQKRLESANLIAERCVALLTVMEEEAGVTPNAHCITVVMAVCSHLGAWGEVNRLFDTMEHDHTEVTESEMNETDQTRTDADNYEDACAGDNQNVPSKGDKMVRSKRVPVQHSASEFECDRSPTVASYHYALIACCGETKRLAEKAGLGVNIRAQRVGGPAENRRANDETPAESTPGVTQGLSAERLEANRFARRAVALVRDVKEAGFYVRPDMVETAKEAAVTAGDWRLATDIHKLFPPRFEASLRGEAIERQYRDSGVGAAERMTAYGRSLRMHDEQQMHS